MFIISLVEISIDASPPCPHSIAGSPSRNLAILRSRLHDVTGRNGVTKIPDLRANEGICNLGAKVMHPSVEFVYPQTDGVHSVDSGAQEGWEDRFSWRKRLALLGGKRGELLGRKGHDAASSFKVTGEEASTLIDVGFRGSSCVRPRGGTKGTREIRRCHSRGSGTRSLCEGKQEVWEGLMHLATWCL